MAPLLLRLIVPMVTHLVQTVGAIIDSRSDGSLGDFMVSFDEKRRAVRGFFTPREIDAIGRRVRQYSYTIGLDKNEKTVYRFNGFQEFFYKNKDRAAFAFRSWVCQRDEKDNCLLSEKNSTVKYNPEAAK